MTEERYFKERAFNNAFAEKIKELRGKHPNHEYETLSHLAALLYPKLYKAAGGDFEDDFDLRTYTEDEPEFEGPADELAHRAKIYSLENQTSYETAASIIMERDPELAERYKMS